MNSPVNDESVGDRSSMSPEGRAMNERWKKTFNSIYSSSQSNPMDSRDRTPEDSDDEGQLVIDESVGDRSSMSPEGRAMNERWKTTFNSIYSSSQSNPMDSRDRTPEDSDDEGQLVIDEESRNAQQNLRLVTEVNQVLEIEEEMTSQASPIPTSVMAPVNPEDESSSTEQIGQQHHRTEELIRVHDSEDMFHESDVGSVIEGTPVVRRIKKPNRASKRGSVGDVDELTKRKSQRFTTTDEADSTENLIDASQLELSTPAVNPSSSSNGQQPLHQAKMLTRADLYDDNDEKQNELIGKEAGYANSTNKPKDSELSRLELFRVQCQLSKLPAPLPFEVFDKKDWNYVTTFDKELLAPDESFLSVQALAEIPRRHSRFPFCHPGPVVDTVSGTEDWYYADSIVQEVKLVQRIQPHYIVRWIGYEDSYNTVEPQSNLVGTAVLILHQKRDHFIGAGASGPTVIRRSTRIMAKRFEQVLHNGNEQVSQCRELQLLDSQLELEERADRYSPAIGFATLTSLPYTLRTQFDFIKNVFFRIIDESNTPGYVLGNSYFGSHGKNRSIELTKAFPKTVKSADTMYAKFKEAFAKANPKFGEASYASFLVLVTHGSRAKATDKKIGFHMCVYTVRRFNKIYDSVYYDPSPECYGHAIPHQILDFKKIANRSSTLLYGPNTNKEDCVYQCMKYIIELHTGQVPFQCKLNSKNFKIKK